MKTSKYTIEQQKPPIIDHIKQIRLDKDGTYYTLIMLHLPKGIMAQTMAHSQPCWLVINTINNTAYAFGEQNYLATDYVGEKLGGNQLKLTKTDLNNIIIAINSVRNKYKRNH